MRECPKDKHVEDISKYSSIRGEGLCWSVIHVYPPLTREKMVKVIREISEVTKESNQLDLRLILEEEEFSLLIEGTCISDYEFFGNIFLRFSCKGSRLMNLHFPYVFRSPIIGKLLFKGTAYEIKLSGLDIVSKADIAYVKIPLGSYIGGIRILLIRIGSKHMVEEFKKLKSKIISALQGNS